MVEGCFVGSGGAAFSGAGMLFPCEEGHEGQGQPQTHQQQQHQLQQQYEYGQNQSSGPLTFSGATSSTTSGTATPISSSNFLPSVFPSGYTSEAFHPFPADPRDMQHGDGSVGMSNLTINGGKCLLQTSPQSLGTPFGSSFGFSTSGDPFYGPTSSSTTALGGLVGYSAAGPSFFSGPLTMSPNAHSYQTDDSFAFEPSPLHISYPGFGGPSSVGMGVSTNVGYPYPANDILDGGLSFGSRSASPSGSNSQVITAYAQLQSATWNYFVMKSEVVLGRQSERQQQKGLGFSDSGKDLGNIVPPQQVDNEGGLVGEQDATNAKTKRVKKPSADDEPDVHIGNDKTVARRHAILSFSCISHQWELLCLGKHGMAVNGVFYPKSNNPVPLIGNARIEIGGVQFSFILPRSNETCSLDPNDPYNYMFLENAVYTVEPHFPSSDEERMPSRSRKRPPPKKGAGRGLEEGIGLLGECDAISRDGLDDTYDDNNEDERKDRSRNKSSQTYFNMVSEALDNAPQNMMTLKEIYAYLDSHFPHIREKKTNWQNSVRHNLSLNKYFRKVDRTEHYAGKSMYWTFSDHYLNEIKGAPLTGGRRKEPAIRRNRRTEPRKPKNNVDQNDESQQQKQQNNQEGSETTNGNPQHDVQAHFGAFLDATDPLDNEEWWDRHNHSQSAGGVISSNVFDSAFIGTDDAGSTLLTNQQQQQQPQPQAQPHNNNNNNNNMLAGLQNFDDDTSSLASSATQSAATYHRSVGPASVFGQHNDAVPTTSGATTSVSLTPNNVPCTPTSGNSSMSTSQEPSPQPRLNGKETAKGIARDNSGTPRAKRMRVSKENNPLQNAADPVALQ